MKLCQSRSLALILNYCIEFNEIHFLVIDEHTILLIAFYYWELIHLQWIQLNIMQQIPKSIV